MNSTIQLKMDNVKSNQDFVDINHQQNDSDSFINYIYMEHLKISNSDAVKKMNSFSNSENKNNASELNKISQDKDNIFNGSKSLSINVLNQNKISENIYNNQPESKTLEEKNILTKIYI